MWSPRNSTRQCKLVALLVAVVIVAAPGCGGGSSSSAGSGSSSDSSETVSQENGSGGSTKPSAEFLGKGENGKLATVGEEASAAEREAASRVIEKSLRARAAGDWATQCTTLAAQLIAGLERRAKTLGAKIGCPSALEAQAAPAPESARDNTMTGPIDVLRINGTQVFAFYHGTENKDYVMPLFDEGGEWKLAVLQEQEIR